MKPEVIEWPYPVEYYDEETISTDVLVIGGGIAGCWAALGAREKGVKVTIVEKSHVISSGPTGCDHWVYTLTNPCCKIKPEELIEAEELNRGGYLNGIAFYIAAVEGWFRLTELERMGAKIRDTEDEFKGAPFRDEETKLLFAYDYENKHTIRVWGQTFKLALYRALTSSGIEVYNRVMITALLNDRREGTKRIAGAIGVNTRTGKLYIFRAKAVVLCTGRSTGRLWLYSGHRVGPTLRVANSTGDGFAVAWKIGARFTLMEAVGPSSIYNRFPSYGTGNPENTWYPCTMVDAKGKEVPYIDYRGRPLKTLEERVRPSLLGQKFFLERAIRREGNPYARPCSLDQTKDFLVLVNKGEHALPLYADLPGMPEHERRAIFGLMVGQEGKTWIVYKNLVEAGFDPDKDMLQSYYVSGLYDPLDPMPAGWDEGLGGYGGLVIDWDMKTNVEGLYAAGDVVFGSHYHSFAAACGKWAGAKAAEYAKKVSEPEIDQDYVEMEKERIYMPIERDDGLDWKELNAGIASIMRNYCGRIKSEELLKLGLLWLNEIERKEAKELCATNPHELIRCLEVLNVLTVAKITLYSCLARRASSLVLRFYRTDYPHLDPPEWTKFICVRLDGNEVKEEYLPLKYWLLPPNKQTYHENYEDHNPWRK